MRIKCTYDFVHFVRVALWEGDDVDLGAEAMFLIGWSASLLFFESFRSEGRGRVNTGTKGGSSCVMLSDHRCLRSALYMAKPSTAHTVAPTLALSQKVEFFRSA